MATPEPQPAAPPPPPPPRRRGIGWLWPLLALQLLVIALLLLVRACGEDDDGQTGATNTAQAEPATGGAGAGDDPSGTLTAGGEDVFAAADASLERLDGDVEGAGGEVVSVVEDAGFWVGSQDARVFVEVEDETGLDELGIEEGAVVDFSGQMERNDEAETYGLRGEDAALFRAQGAHVSVQAADVVVE